MSIRVSSIVWDYFQRGGSEKLVLLAMADWCNDLGESLHPSISAVAAKACVSVSQAKRIVHGLISNGFLQVVGNQNGGAPGMTRQYRLCVERLTETGSADATPKTARSVIKTPTTGSMDAPPECETGSTGATGSMDATGSTHAPRRVAPVRETGSTHAPLTTIEPPKNRQLKNSAPTKVDADELLADGLNSEQVANWLAVRKRKRAGPLLPVQWNSYKAEAASIGWTVSQMVDKAILKNWASFEASYVKVDPVVRAYESTRDKQRREVIEGYRGKSNDVIDI